MKESRILHLEHQKILVLFILYVLGDIQAPEWPLAFTLRMQDVFHQICNYQCMKDV
jgi:hypothetical protein